MLNASWEKVVEKDIFESVLVTLWGMMRVVVSRGFLLAFSCWHYTWSISYS